jgi:hypothetical protein
VSLGERRVSSPAEEVREWGRAVEEEYARATDPRRDGTVPESPADALRASRVDLVERIENGIPEREFVPGCDPYLIRGKRYMMFSPAGEGKSLIALVLAVTIVEHGGTAVILDVENGADEYARRLEDLLVSRDASARDACRDRLAYYEWPRLRLKWNSEEWATALSGADLVTFDSSRLTLSAVGLDEDSNDDYAAFANAMLIPLTREGATTLVLDNTGHEETTRARGASAKRDLNEVIYLAKVGEPFDRDRLGHVRLLRNRTRFSDLPEELKIPLGAGTYGPVEIATPKAESGGFRPTGLMEKASREIEQTPGLGRNDVLTAIGGKREYASLAVAKLIAEGFVRPERDGQAIRHHSIRPYRESEDRSQTED